MYPEEFSLTINETTYRAVWFDKEDDRKAEWCIYRNGTKIGKFAGYPGNYKQVENFIRFWLAK